jgi:hypothetical protein
MRLIILFLILTLSGCESDQVKLSKACETLDLVCNNLKVDSRCLSLRRDLVIGLYAIKQKPNNEKQYEQMLLNEKYIACAEKSTWIEYKDPTIRYAELDKASGKKPSDEVLILRNSHIKRQLEQTRDRIETFHYSKYLLSELDASSAKSQYPYFLYWHWSRNNNLESLEKLKIMDEQNKISQYDMHYRLSQYYIKRDKSKAISSLMKSLTLYPEELYVIKDGSKHNTVSEEGNLHYSIFRSLSSIYFKNKDYEKSYVFAKLLEINNDKSPNIEMIIKYFKNESSSRIDFLNDKAENIHDLLNDGKFKSYS